MRKRLNYAGARGPVDRRLPELHHVTAVLSNRDRRHADVLATFEKQHRAGTPCIGDAVPVRGTADHRAPDDLAMVLARDGVDRAFEQRKAEADSIGQLRAGEFACEMQRFKTSWITVSSVRPDCSSVGGAGDVWRIPEASQPMSSSQLPLLISSSSEARWRA